MVSVEELQEQIDILNERQGEMMKLIYQLHARFALQSPEKRMVIGIANRVALEKMSLQDKYDDDIFYKHCKKSFYKSRLTTAEEADISQAQFLCWHLLLSLGKLTHEEVGNEYGFVSHCAKTAMEIKKLQKTAIGRAIVEGAESRFKEEFELCIFDNE